MAHTEWKFDRARLATFRELMNLSSEDVARALKLTRKTINNWEAGKTAPTVVQLCQLANQYNVDPTSFFVQSSSLPGGKS